jgi:hypothetical protein
MGFILRTVFWLGLAVAILPPKARLGGADTADFDHVDIGIELQNATAAAWSFGASALRTCETNPQLCKAGNDLWKTTLATGTHLIAEMRNNLETQQVTQVAMAEPPARGKKKIQARVE